MEYVHDLTRAPHLPDLQRLTALSGPLRENGDRLIRHLRDRHAPSYTTIANTVEIRLEEEFKHIGPEDLGKIDTFRQEETTVLEKGALEALERQDWPSALTWANTRLDADSFWLKRDPQRRIEWTLIQSMAHLGSTLQQVGQALEPGQSLQEALAAYTSSGYQVDLAHRHLEQQCSQLLESTLPHANELRICADQLRQNYRHWANQWAEAFSQICDSEGFLPDPALQQRTLYDDVVHPLTQNSAKAGRQAGHKAGHKTDSAKVAYFLVDAFRYEMATELLLELQGAGTTAILKGRYAELPTLTAVGMNALAPVVAKGGKLTLATGKSGATFVHGGNSLQERVIPVLTVSHRSNSSRLRLVQYEIQARAKPPLAGFSRLQVKVQPIATPQGILSFTGTKTVNLSLRVPNRPDIDLNLAEAPEAQLKNQQVTVEIDQDWTDILFDLKGLKDERVKVEVYQCDGAEDVTAAIVETYFEVAGLKRKEPDDEATQSQPAKSNTTPENIATTPADWQDSFDDEPIRNVFLHLHQHSSITEAELIKMLGNARKARRFALNFEAHLQKVPFGVRVETAGSGKRYVKEQNAE